MVLTQEGQFLHMEDGLPRQSNDVWGMIVPDAPVGLLVIYYRNHGTQPIYIHAHTEQLLI